MFIIGVIAYKYFLSWQRKRWETSANAMKARLREVHEQRLSLLEPQQRLDGFLNKEFLITFQFRELGLEIQVC
jgi:hypothetical protein